MDSQELRGAVVRGDTALLLAGLTESTAWPEFALQTIGDGLLLALTKGAESATDPARRSLGELRDRDWDGDRELAAALAAQVEDAPLPMLRPLPVDLEELAAILEGDPVNGGGRVRLDTGDVWPQPAVDYGVEEGEIDPEGPDDQWLWVECTGSRSGYRDMQRFIDLVDDERLAERLWRALDGRGAFRRFRDRLFEHEELVTRWRAFSQERERGRARAWLADAGYTPVHRWLQI